MQKINAHIKTIFITLVLLNVSLSGDNKNTLLNLKLKIDNEFRQTLDMNPNLYKIWIGTKDGSQELSEPIINSGKSKTYIPGLPGSAPLIEEVYTSNKVSEIFNYIVDIYIDDEYNQPFQINRIKGVILDVWPAFGTENRLEENVTIRVVAFQAQKSSKEDTELQKLEQKQRDLEKSLSDLEKKYSDQEAAKNLETQILELNTEQELDLMKLDLMIQELKNTLSQSERNFDENLKFRLEYLEQQFKSTQQFKDSLLNKMRQEQNREPEIAYYGCMDPEATNYDIRATKNCRRCCTYSHSIDLCDCLMKPGDSYYMKKNKDACDKLISYRLGVKDWKKINFSKNKKLDAKFDALARRCS